MPLTKPMAEALAHLTHLLRADLATRTGCKGWDEAGVLKQLAQVAGLPAEDVCLAAIRAAVDQGASTPGVIPALNGPHWHERPSGGRAPRNPMPHEECRTHPGQFRASCSGCRSEALAPDDQPYGDVRPASAGDVRAQLQMARGGLCSHGVSPDHCLQEHPTDQPAEEAS